jgi:DNA-binding MarR family transcriptional regulator
MIRSLEGRGLIERTRQAKDKRAVGLHLTEAGEALMATAEKTADALEIKATSKLTTPERATLNRLLQKVYLPTA